MNDPLEAEVGNGVYLIVSDARDGYIVESTSHAVQADRVRINGAYFVVDGTAEFECDDYAFENDNGRRTLDLRFDDD